MEIHTERRCATGVRAYTKGKKSLRKLMENINDELGILGWALVSCDMICRGVFRCARVGEYLLCYKN